MDCQFSVAKLDRVNEQVEGSTRTDHTIRSAGLNIVAVAQNHAVASPLRVEKTQWARTEADTVSQSFSKS